MRFARSRFGFSSRDTGSVIKSETGERAFNWKRISIIVAVVAVATWIGFAALREPELPEFVASGEPLELPTEGSFPQISLSQFEGILVGLQGQPVVVNIWASWCAPCRTEMPLLQKAADTYAGRAVILGVASNDDPSEAQRFLTEMDLTYPNVFDTTGDIRVALGLTAFPTTYIFGSDGQIRARVNGGISEQRLASLIEDALE